jgi:hypothetical protein
VLGEAHRITYLGGIAQHQPDRHGAQARYENALTFSCSACGISSEGRSGGLTA